MMLVWNNLADPHLSAFSDFARFSQTLTLNYLQFSFNDQTLGPPHTRLIFSCRFLWEPLIVSDASIPNIFQQLYHGQKRRYVVDD